LLSLCIILRDSFPLRCYFGHVRSIRGLVAKDMGFACGHIRFREEGCHKSFIYSVSLKK